MARKRKCLAIHEQSGQFIVKFKMWLYGACRLLKNAVQCTIQSNCYRAQIVERSCQCKLWRKTSNNFSRPTSDVKGSTKCAATLCAYIKLYFVKQFDFIRRTGECRTAKRTLDIAVEHSRCDQTGSKFRVSGRWLLWVAAFTWWSEQKDTWRNPHQFRCWCATKERQE